MIYNIPIMPDKIKAQNSKLKTADSISVIIYACNDERNIGRCIASAQLLSPNVILANIGSTDQTAEIAKRLGAQVVIMKQTKYVETVRMDGIRHSTTDWIFILDSDEVISPELACEITSVISAQSSAVSNLTSDNLQLTTAYRVPRKNIFGKSKWLKHGGWWPDSQIRLIKRSELVDWPSIIHSTPQIKGTCATLKEPLMHYSHGDFSQMVKKTIKFEGVESDLLHQAGKKTSTITFFRKFFGELYRRLIKQKGFLDGKEGIAESIYQAYSKTVTYLMLYEKNRSL